MQVFLSALVFSLAIVSSTVLITRALAVLSQRLIEVHKADLELAKETLSILRESVGASDRFGERSNTLQLETVRLFLSHAADTQVIGGQPVRIAEQTIKTIPRPEDRQPQKQNEYLRGLDEAHRNVRRVTEIVSGS